MNELVPQKIHIGQYNGSSTSYKIASMIPFGEYTVELHQMRMVVTNDNVPAFMMSFAPVDSGKLLSMVQIIKEAFQVHTVNEFLRSMTNPEWKIEFITYTQYAALIDDVFNELKNQKFRLKYSQHKHGESIEVTPLD